MIEILFLIGFSLLIFSWEVVLFSFSSCVVLSMLVLHQSFTSGIDTFFMFSSISNLLVFLSCLLCFLSLIATPEEKLSGSYMICLLSLCMALVLAFSSSNLIMFYVFFEISLIPTLVLIIGWGYQPERLQAGTYMMLYTVGASLPLLMLILWSCWKMSSMDMYMLHISSSEMSGMLSFVIYGAFLVKLPMYGLHLWLPKAHVEAPLAGSMILAGILLKLGGYGMVQMNFCLNMKLDVYSWAIIGLSMWGGLLATLMCLRQVDVKSLVAYSSVGHMGIVSSGVLLDSSWGVISAVVTMMAHGFSSSAMFCLAYFSYKKSHTRNIPYMKGVLQIYPILSMLWFIFCCINMACPPTLNLMGEMAIIPSLWSNSFWLAVVMGLMVFFSASYNMYLYSSINHGSFSSYFLSGFPMKSYCCMVLFAHMFPLFLILKSNLFNFY
uniref:NADH-ubiquinone oxidoreductase chain 4 n=1 Tax=Doriprismatica atromarginata TaxID=154629 RepID=A0A895KYA3_DORAT|nr:NADH dehydrogenase subunit 4 [Doriprismatica atromarginata]QRZ60634.1 NADH dehydrogenase subunit 4 [Doriprismatica atromarginata]